LYGRGPQDSPYLYDVRQNDKFIFGSGENRQEQDLPRNHQGVAIIGDPRNDENIMISQLHVAFLRFHNSVVYRLESTSNLSGDALFREAQRIVQWQYQWIVVNDYLCRYVVADPGYVEQLIERATRRPFSGFVAYSWKEAPFLPIEFSGAAFRFGHAMIRSSYDINYAQQNIPFISIPGPWGDDPQQQLTGYRRLPAGFTIQWDRFFRFAGSPEPQRSRQIDTSLSAVLSNLPGQLAPYPTSLAFLDLARGWRLGLPSGQSAARAVGIHESEVLDGDEPLW
jgi:Animal haem peroxidase